MAVERGWKHRGLGKRWRGALETFGGGHRGCAGCRLALSFFGAAAMLSACVGLPGFPPEGEDTTTMSLTTSSGEHGSFSDSNVMTSSLTGTTVEPMSTSTGVDDTSTTGSSSSTGEVSAGPFVFDETPFEDYVQVDRKGFPATNTFLNLIGDKDAYNQASPADDAALMFATNIFESLETWHLGAPGRQVADNTGLDDDLAAFGLEPCVTPPLPMDTCDSQMGAHAIIDVLTIDTDDPSGFPNGRRLEDPVVDLIFAFFLLDLDTHPTTLWLDLDGDGSAGPSLNPLANDVSFPGEFPYLAPANQ